MVPYNTGDTGTALSAMPSTEAPVTAELSADSGRNTTDPTWWAYAIGGLVLVLILMTLVIPKARLARRMSKSFGQFDEIA